MALKQSPPIAHRGERSLRVRGGGARFDFFSRCRCCALASHHSTTGNSMALAARVGKTLAQRVGWAITGVSQLTAAAGRDIPPGGG